MPKSKACQSPDTMKTPIPYWSPSYGDVLSGLGTGLIRCMSSSTSNTSGDVRCLLSGAGSRELSPTNHPGQRQLKRRIMELLGVSHQLTGPGAFIPAGFLAFPARMLEGVMKP